MEQCAHCHKDCKNRNSRLNHQRYCKSNHNRIDSPFKSFKEKNRQPWNKGQTSKDFPQLARTEDVKENLRGKCSGLAATPEAEAKRREKIRIKILERYANGWESTAGRCKKLDYNSPIAGNIKVDGSWELAAAKYFDRLGLTWNRNKLRFPYIAPNGKSATYQPDFFIVEWNTFLEVKGYETELDKCKWEQFNYPLLIWRKEQILEIMESKSIRH